MDTLPWSELIDELSDMLMLETLRTARDKGITVDPIAIEAMVKSYVSREVTKLADDISRGTVTPGPELAAQLAKQLLGTEKPSRTVPKREYMYCVRTLNRGSKG